MDAETLQELMITSLLVNCIHLIHVPDAALSVIVGIRQRWVHLYVYGLLSISTSWSLRAVINALLDITQRLINPFLSVLFAIHFLFF